MEYKVETRPVLVLPSPGHDYRLTLRVIGVTRACRSGDRVGEIIDREREHESWSLDVAPPEVDYYRQVIVNLKDRVARELDKRLAAIQAATQAVGLYDGEIIYRSEEEDP